MFYEVGQTHQTVRPAPVGVWFTAVASPADIRWKHLRGAAFLHSSSTNRRVSRVQRVIVIVIILPISEHSNLFFFFYNIRLPMYKIRTYRIGFSKFWRRIHFNIMHWHLISKYIVIGKWCNSQNFNIATETKNANIFTNLFIIRTKFDLLERTNKMRVTILGWNGVF